MLAMAHPPVLPSAMRNDVGTPFAIISQLNTLPACAPVNASMAASRLDMHDSGSVWIATPFLYDFFIHNSTPVYPGALIILLKHQQHRKLVAWARMGVAECSRSLRVSNFCTRTAKPATPRSFGTVMVLAAAVFSYCLYKPVILCKERARSQWTTAKPLLNWPCF